MAPLNILLAEDNPINKKLAVRFLEREGHHVTAVESGAEVLKILARRSFDVILMDIQMPDMDGMEATKRIRSGEAPVVDPNIPIIATTAHAMKGDREKFLAIGMNDYISKPIKMENLYEVIGRVVVG